MNRTVTNAYAPHIPAEAEYVQYDYDLEFLAEYIGGEEYEDITGAFVVGGDGDYDRIFVTWSSAPYLTSTAYYEVTIRLH